VDSEVLRQPLNYVVGRNPDMAEATLTGPDGRTLRFARAYGFRNIQSVVTKMRRGRLDVDFVEVMACPGGCLNGGGQLQVGLVTQTEGADAGAGGAGSGSGLTVEKLRAGRERVAHVDALFHARSSPERAEGRALGPENSPLCRLVYGSGSTGGMGLTAYGDAARALLHTR